MLKIYYMDVACGCSDEQSQRFYEALPKERRLRIDRMKNEKKKKQAILSGACLQTILSRELGISKSEIAFTYEVEGKPQLSNDTIARTRKLEFNMSHSGKYIVVGISDMPIGIDVEKLKKNRKLVGKRFFTMEEYEDILKGKTEEEQEIRFVEYWTMKEAYLKRSGEGLSRRLNSFIIKKIEKNLSKVEGEEIFFKTLVLEDASYRVSVCSKCQNDIWKVADKCVHLSMKDLIDI